MGHRTFVTFGCVAMMFVSQAAFALGLGDITLRSSLNQPLVAEIKLLEVGDLTEAEILVGLASQEDFERVGVDRPFFLSDLAYQVRLGTPRGNLIVVSSRKPVREPYLNFIVQVRWPSGRLLREYTVLMDLPVFSDQSSGAVAPAQSGNSIGEREEPESLASGDRFASGSSRDVQPAQEIPAQNDFVSDGGSGAGSGTYGPVKANDTLWDIAARARPNSNTSIQQTMIAIQSLNPEAFINNNINLLKRGQVLRLPDSGQVRDISLQQANARVAQQNSEWTGSGAENQAQLDARNFSSVGVGESKDPEGRVKLSSPDNAFDASEGRGSGAGDSSAEALENELAITLEQLDKSNRENSELRSKIESLEEQIATMERMVEVSSEDLRALELSIEKTSQQNAALDAANQNRADEEAQLAGDIAEDISDRLQADLQSEVSSDDNFARVDDEVDTQSSDVALDEAQLADSIASDLSVTDDEASVQETVVTRADEAPETISGSADQRGFVGMLMDNIIYIAAVVFALGIGAFFFISHNRANRDEELDDDDELLQMPAFDEPLVAQQDTAEEDPAAGFEDIDDVFAEEDAEPLDRAFGEENPEPQTGDVASEASIYIAYEKYEQAAEMLKKALVDQPDNTDLHLKLLEV
ncbi:MAG: LysM peptidoglycan-binding domain-containing protein, partial [Cellvibrionaceae bacterium]|nr:LysM peptidoglycan-binding domain-containing protein [Cellvibrionaceae bacterium]